jgi:hypothetical protein
MASHAGTQRRQWVHMVRPGTVVGGAAVIGVLAVIALLMGVFAAMPDKGGAGSCGHLLDRTRSAPASSRTCRSALHERRIEVTAAAVVGGGAAIVGVVAYGAMIKAP